MANIRLILRRRKTAKNIAQITKAMEMVSASKMRRAQERTVAGKPYTEKLHMLVQNLVGKLENATHPYLQKRETGKTLILIVAPDKGLCGSLNTNLLREFLRLTREEKEISIVVVGKKMQRGVVYNEGKLIADFPFGTVIPLFETVFPLSKLIVDGFVSGEYKKVIALYTKFTSVSTQKPYVETLLPIENTHEVGKEEVANTYTFEPNAATLLDALMPHYLEMSLYQMLLESYASEQAARMLAMHQASENAKDVITELSLYYNKERQSKITSELLDIVGGQILSS